MVWRARVQMELGRLREAEDSFGRALRFVAERGVGSRTQAVARARDLKLI
jgi:hypothetical protein